MDLPGDKNKTNPKNVTHEAMMKSLQSQRRVLGRVIKNEKDLKEVVDQIIVLGLRLDGQLNVIGRNGERIRTIEEAIASGELKGEKGDTGEAGKRGKTGRRGRGGRRGRSGDDGFDNRMVTLEVYDINDADALGNNAVYSNGQVIGRATGGNYGFRVKNLWFTST